MNFKEGEVLYFDKPLKWTSFAVVNKIRYHICRKLGVKKIKVGHAGTLDPLATGVMIICTGKATKRIEEFQYHTKEYIATLQLGATTPSFDLEKEIDATYPTEHITRELVEEALQRFIGRIERHGFGDGLLLFRYFRSKQMGVALVPAQQRGKPFLACLLYTSPSPRD